MQKPERLSALFLVFIVLNAIHADHREYLHNMERYLGVYDRLLAGRGAAPEQYRIGVLKAANLIGHHVHIGLESMLSLIDIAAAFIAVFTLFALLIRSSAYIKSSLQNQWFGCAAFLLLVQFNLHWVPWYIRPETLTATMITSLIYFLLNRRLSLPGKLSYLAASLCMITLTVMEGFIRADAALGFHLGIILFCLFSRKDTLALPRVWQVITSFICALVAAGTQVYIMKVVYPHATYEGVPVFMFLVNFKLWKNDGAFVLFIPPYLWTMYLMYRNRLKLAGSATAAALSSIVYFAMWITFGRIEEVRIFLPFSLMLVPVAIGLAMNQNESVSSPAFLAA